MSLQHVMAEAAAELALFAALGFLLFSLDDLLVDLIYFARRAWRSATVYSRFPRSFAGSLARQRKPGLFAILVPAWDEATVIAEIARYEAAGVTDFCAVEFTDDATERSRTRAALGAVR